jgi:hypothetical protein
MTTTIRLFHRKPTALHRHVNAIPIQGVAEVAILEALLAAGITRRQAIDLLDVVPRVLLPGEEHLPRVLKEADQSIALVRGSRRESDRLDLSRRQDPVNPPRDQRVGDLPKGVSQWDVSREVGLVASQAVNLEGVAIVKIEVDNHLGLNEAVD